MEEKLLLKTYWDNAFAWDTKIEAQEIIFADREKEISRIRDFLLRKNQGSLLISGQKGCGKTSLVIKCLKEISKENPRFLPIYLNALRLEAICQKNNEYEFLDCVYLLKQLIKSLSRELDKNEIPIPSSLKDLCKDIDATELILRYKSSSSAGIKGETGLGVKVPLWSVLNIKSELATIYGKEWDEEKIYEKTGLSIEDLIHGFSNVISEIESTSLDDNHGPSNEKALNFLRSVWQKIQKANDKQKSGDTTANLPSKKSKIKIVFTIDELDFFDNQNDQNKNPKMVLDAIKKFKNLFTLSSAQFIFIVGENTYRDSLDPKTYKTLFTERIFLPQPSGTELSQFMDNILDQNLANGQKLKWEKQKSFMIWKAKHNFYNLVEQIKNISITDGNERIYALVKELNPTENFISALHRASDVIYKHYFHEPIEWQWNEAILEELCSVINDYQLWVATTNKSTIHISMTSLSSGLDNTPKDKTAILGSKHTFIRYIYRLCEQEIPDNFESQDSFHIPWEQLQNLKFETIGLVRGAVTSEDKELENRVKELTLALKLLLRLLGKSYNTTLSDLFDKIESLDLGITFPTEQILLIQKVADSVSNTEIWNRSQQDTKKALESLGIIEEMLSPIVIFKTLIFRNHYGKLKKNDVLVLGDDNSHGHRLYTRASIIGLKNINISRINFDIELQNQNSIFNLLLDTEKFQDEVNSSFYMFRLDARMPDEDKGEGILFKTFGVPDWNYIDGKVGRRLNNTTNSLIKARVIIKTQQIIFERIIGTKYKEIARIDNNKKITGIAVSNEIGPVGIKKIRIIISN